MPDLIVTKLTELERRIAHLETNAEAGGDANTVDGFSASAAALPNTLIALAADANLPDDTVDFGSLELAAQVWCQKWDDVVAWTLAANVNWQTDTQNVVVTPRRLSDVIVIGDIMWGNTTAARIDNMEMRWNLGGVAGTGSGNIGTTFNLRQHTAIVEVFTDVAAAAQTLVLNARKPIVGADTVIVWQRHVVVAILPKD